MANTPKKVGSAFVEIFVKHDLLKSGLNKARDLFSKAISELVSFAKRGAIALGAALAGGAVYFTKLAMDAVEAKNLFDVVFGSMTDAATKWVDETAKAYRANKYDLMRYYSTFQQLITGFGVGGDAANVMSQNMTKLVYDLASFRNLSRDEAFQKLMSGMAGQTEPLMSLGVNLQDLAVEQWARQSGLIGDNVKQMDNLTKVYARYGLLLDKTKLDQGDKIKTQDSPANAIRDLIGQFKELGTTAAITVLPKITEWLKQIRVRFDQSRDAIVQFMENGLNGITSFVDKMGGLDGILDATARGLQNIADKMSLLIELAKDASVTVWDFLVGAGASDTLAEIDEINKKYAALMAKRREEEAARIAGKNPPQPYKNTNPLSFIDSKLGNMAGGTTKGSGGITGTSDIWKSIASAAMTPAEKKQINLQEDIAANTARMAAALERGGGIGLTA